MAYVEGKMEESGFLSQFRKEAKTPREVAEMAKAADDIVRANLLLAWVNMPWLRFQKKVDRLLGVPEDRQLYAAVRPQELDRPKTKAGVFWKETKELAYDAFWEGFEESYQETVNLWAEGAMKTVQATDREATFWDKLDHVTNNFSRVVFAGALGSALGLAPGVVGFPMAYMETRSDFYKEDKDTKIYKRLMARADFAVEARMAKNAEVIKLVNELKNLQETDPRVQEIKNRLEEIRKAERESYENDALEMTRNFKATGVAFTERQVQEQVDYLEKRIKKIRAVADAIQGADVSLDLAAVKDPRSLGRAVLQSMGIDPTTEEGLA
ncbi:MAG: hypothetical protein RMM53_12065, partial [Bacteroidia bacterium]|nr:hypothetical protein [Bacteroidia bacterium]